MATQRITIAKIAGAAGEAVLTRFRAWTSARLVDDPLEWTPEQWPAECRREMDVFAAALRAHAHEPPVVYFSEHVDLWSMSDVFLRSMTLADPGSMLHVFADRYELTCCRLPDGGALAEAVRRTAASARRHSSGPNEEIWLETRLREAALAWDGIVETAAIVVLREVLGGLVTDDELEASLASVPGWLAELEARPAQREPR